MIEGMTPEKLRDIADWLDAAGAALIEYMDDQDAREAAQAGETVYVIGPRQAQFVEQVAMSADLRAWADALEL